MRRLACVLLILLGGCPKPQLALYDSSDPGLVKTLGVTRQEWQTLQTQINSHLRKQEPDDLRIIHWGRRKPTGDIEVWCRHTMPTSATNSGPVFFFRRVDEQWHLITEEMSEWRDP